MVELGYLKWQLRRGKLELDVVLQKFIERHPLEGLSNQELVALERLLTVSDDELLELFLRRAIAPDAAQAELMEKILDAADHPAG